MHRLASPCVVLYHDAPCCVVLRRVQVDALCCMFADETHHRDVNHTLAELKQDAPNPFVGEHKANALRAWRMEATGEPAWPHSVADGAPTEGLAAAAIRAVAKGVVSRPHS